MDCQYRLWHYNEKCLCTIKKAFYYPDKLNPAICIYIALAISGHTLYGQQTSVNCHRYLCNFAKQNYLQMLSIMLLLLLIINYVMLCSYDNLKKTHFR